MQQTESGRKTRGREGERAVIQTTEREKLVNWKPKTMLISIIPAIDDLVKKKKSRQLCGSILGTTKTTKNRRSQPVKYAGAVSGKYDHSFQSHQTVPSDYTELASQVEAAWFQSNKPNSRVLQPLSHMKKIKKINQSSAITYWMQSHIVWLIT